MSTRDVVGLTLLAGSLLVGFLLVPDLEPSLLLQPAFWAVVAAGVVFVRIVLWHASGRHGTEMERWALASFLALMPTVYLVSWAASGVDRSWLWIELAGQVVFAGIALLSLRRTPWLLGVGILAHGVLWDIWHHGQAPFIPDWYTVACLIVDVGWGTYALTQPYGRD